MKQIYIFTAFLLFSSIATNAQIIPVVNPANGAPTGFSFAGNNLYYTQYTTGAIVKIDATASTPTTPTNVVSSLNNPEGIAVAGNFIYFTQGANKISKVDINNPTTIIDVVIGLNEPNGLLINGNDLYIAEIGAGKISKINITATTPTTPVQVVSGLIVPVGLALSGNYLYIAEADGGNKISKIDITNPSPTIINVATGLNKPLQLALSGTTLYITEVDGNKISKIDITAPVPTSTSLVTTITSPECLALNGDYLYFSHNGSTVISKFNLNPLSTEDHTLETIKIHPNPTADYIQVSGLTEETNYTIYDILGKKTGEGTISEKSKIDVKNLNNGLYLLKFENGNTIKFVKE